MKKASTARDPAARRPLIGAARSHSRNDTEAKQLTMILITKS
jgi:hypothetical protein